MKRQAHCEKCAGTYAGWYLALEALAIIAVAAALWLGAAVLR